MQGGVRNLSKTKELLVDFRREQPTAPTLEVNGQTIERVEEFKYLGSTINHKLTFKTNEEHDTLQVPTMPALPQKDEEAPAISSAGVLQILCGIHTELQYHSMVWRDERYQPETPSTGL